MKIWKYENKKDIIGKCHIKLNIYLFKNIRNNYTLYVGNKLESVGRLAIKP